MAKVRLKWKTRVCEPIEPTKEDVLDAVKDARAYKPDIVIGLGGGSCMDTAKIIAVMLTNEEELENYFVPDGKEVAEKDPLPTIMIPTTSGTGSELSNSAVVIIEGGRKVWIAGSKGFSKLALIDPTFTLSLPPRPTAGSGMDALSHTVEEVMSKQSSPLSDALSLEAIKLISRNLRRAYHAGEDLESRSNMALAAAFGGWVISFPATGAAFLGHCMSEGVSAKYGIPHGESCGVLLPYVCEFNLPNCIDKLSMVASAMDVDTSELSPREAAMSAAKAIFTLLEDIELPTALKEYNIPKQDIPQIVDYIIKERQYLYDLPSYNPRKLTEKNLTEFLEKAWEGKNSLEII